MTKLKWLIVLWLLIGSGVGFAITRLFFTPDVNEDLANSLAAETLAKNEAQQRVTVLVLKLDSTGAEINALLEAQKHEATAASTVSVARVFDAKTIEAMIDQYELNRSLSKNPIPYDFLTALDEKSARIGLSELRYATIINIEHREFKRKLTLSEEQGGQYEKRILGLRRGVTECSEMLGDSNEKLAEAEKRLAEVPGLPFFDGIFLRGGIYSGFNKGVLDMAEKVYSGTVGLNFQTEGWEFAPIVGVAVYPVKERTVTYNDQIQERTTSKAAFGWGVEFKLKVN